MIPFNPPQIENVLFIVNSDVANSEVAADWYIAQRGLTSAHKLNIALGTATTISQYYDDTFANIITPIRNYLVANPEIEAVILSLGCPRDTFTISSPDDGSDNTRMVLQCFCAHAVFYYDQGLNVDAGYGGPGTRWTGLNPNYYDNNLFAENLVDYGFSTGRIDGITSTIIDRHYFFMNTAERVRNTTMQRGLRFSGMLGTSRNAPLSQSLSEFQDQVTNALWAEQNLTIEEAPFVFGYHDRSTFSNMRAWHERIVDRDVTRMGYSVTRFVQTYSAGYPDQPGVNFPDWDYTAAEWNDPLNPAGITDVPCFAYFGTTPVNIPNSTGGWVDKMLIKRGAIGYGSTSRFQADDLRLAGTPYKASCVIGPSSEPFTSGVVIIDSLATMLLRGYSCTQAMCLASDENAWQMACDGDPLYRPFLNVLDGSTEEIVKPDASKVVPLDNGIQDESGDYVLDEYDFFVVNA